MIPEYVIISSPRSGSNFLMQAFGSFEGGAGFFEVFGEQVFGLDRYHGIVQNLSKLTDLPDMSEADVPTIKRFHERPIDTIGKLNSACHDDGRNFLSYKVFPHQIPLWAVEGIIMREHVRPVFLLRSMLDSFISMTKADQRDVWQNADTSEFKPVLNKSEFEHYRDDLDSWFLHLSKFLNENGKPFHTLRYEQDVDVPHEDLLTTLSQKVLTHKGLTFDVSKPLIFTKQDRTADSFDKIENGATLKEELGNKGKLADFTRYPTFEKQKQNHTASSAAINRDPFKSKFANFRILDPENLTIYTSFDLLDPWQFDLAALEPAALKSRKSLHLMDTTWHCHGTTLKKLKANYDRAKAACPLAEFVLLVHTPFCAYRLNRAGVPAIYGHSSAFEDENVWTIEEPGGIGLEPVDAIYNARLLKWKNHSLTQGLSKPLFVYEGSSVTDEILAEYRQAFQGACFANHDLNGGTYKIFDAAELSKIMAHAKVSLALSSEEGFMRASVQSLLAGKPVVSIPNKGGRNRFYHADTAIIVDESEKAVAAGVKELITRDLAPEFVRRETLKLLEIERREFLETFSALRADVFDASVSRIGLNSFRGINFRRKPVLDILEALLHKSA